MKRKRIYIKPLSHIVLLHGSIVMLGGSDTVENMDQGDTYVIGDKDEPTTPTTPARGFTWEED